jgi:DNA-directed RNA polymerase subunit F
MPLVGVFPFAKLSAADGVVVPIPTSPLKVALAKVVVTQNGYSVKEIATSLGEEDVNVKDALDLVQDEIEKKMAELKKAERENFVALNFIVDKDPKKSADEFIKAVTVFAKTKGVKVGKVIADVNPQRETIALVSFNVTNPQKDVIDEAVSALIKETKMTESEAIAEICSRFLKPR